MILVAATLLGLAVTDLLRWTPEDASIPRTAWSTVGGAGAVIALAGEAAGTPASDGEVKLRGGRLLGPMERIIVAGLVVAAEPAGAALVIAAKGLLRFPEIRDSTEGPGERESRQGSRVGPADVTEYFLIGTFASLILAAAVGLLVVAAP